MAKTMVEVDPILAPMEVYARAKAWFMTVAYTSVRCTNWFDLQTAVFAADKIFELVQRTSHSQCPPVHFLLEAWANTLSHFAEAVRISGKPLKEVVLNIGTWEHKWAWTSPNAAALGGAAVDLPKDVQMDVMAAREAARQYQSMMDRQKNEENRKRNELNNYAGAKGNGGKSGGKGKFGGKGKAQGKGSGGHRGFSRERGNGHRDRSRGRGGDRR
jgi:hypothetical protein